ncbi:hypothetical protein O181_027656 [Austropuccinia psidii MF-1]|uniref:Tet-like 2OG-Fe(II) oxygenase domain-containing protein n=1 Tax=Austropuccinia psidii MF-1 TaxID=1389203 RepID=A0A9Q3CSX0_9BASI|nr:hypothetical protein [Austropuccinia psidii MF-1]
MTPSEVLRLVDVNQIKRIHFGRVAIFSSTRLLIALVKSRPFTTISEAKVNQWDELSQFLCCKRRFTDPIATNGALLEGLMFAIGWRKCSTKNEQFGHAADASHANHCACTSSQQFKQLPMPVQAPEASQANPYIVQVPDNLNIYLWWCRLPIIHMQILMILQVPNNSNNSLCWCRLWTIHMPMIMLVQVPEILKIPYTCAAF